jgi:hypothetical protein
MKTIPTPTISHIRIELPNPTSFGSNNVSLIVLPFTPFFESDEALTKYKTATKKTRVKKAATYFPLSSSSFFCFLCSSKLLSIWCPK